MIYINNLEKITDLNKRLADAGGDLKYVLAETKQEAEVAAKVIADDGFDDVDEGDDTPEQHQRWEAAPWRFV